MGKVKHRHTKYTIRIWYQLHAEYEICLLLDTPGKIVEKIFYTKFICTLNTLFQSEDELCEAARSSLEMRVWEQMGRGSPSLLAEPGLSLG